VDSRATIIIPVRDRAAFLEMYSEKNGLGGMFVEGEIDLPLGEALDLEVHFVSEQVVFRIRGAVKWRRAHSSRKSVPPGLGLEFAADDRAAQRLLLDFAHGAAIPMVERSARRYGVQMPARYRGADGRMVTEVTDDLSEGGAFIRSQNPPQVGQTLELKLLPDRSVFGVGVKAVVAWRKTEGRSGFGVEFLFDGSKRRGRVKKVLESVHERILREVRVRR
jgi:Tfp pilus assembly protein PilZ